MPEDCSDSSAKESGDEDDYEIPNPDGVSAADKAKLQRLQIRNLKRLREKVKEEEEKLRALNRSSSNVNVGSSQLAAAKIKGGASAAASEVIAITDNNNSASAATLTPPDYDADLSCSALESPKKVNKVSY